MTDRNDDLRDDRQDESLTERGINDSASGKADNLKGKAKDAWGGLTGDTSTQVEGKFDQLKGKAKDKLGQVERDADQDR